MKPDIIYLENVPLGPEGPFGQDGGYDVVVQGPQLGVTVHF